MIADGWIRLGDHVDEWGAAIPAGMPAADLTGHMALLGTTNSGKSTFLRNLILQYYGLGGTVVLLEPHGDLLFDAEEGILAALDRRQLAGVQLIDVEQEAAGWPISINLVGSGLVDGRERAVQQAMRAIHAMEPANWEMAVRMREIIENALHLLLDTRGERASLVDLHRFLVDRRFRERTIREAGPAVQLMAIWWERHLDQWMEPKRRESLADILEPAERRVLGFLRDSRFRHTLALPPIAPGIGFDLEGTLNAPTPNLLLLHLRSPEGKRVYGTLFMQQLAAIFQRRARLSHHERRPVLVVIDEFPDLATGELGEIVGTLLAQARKFGAAVVLSAQSLMQLPPAVQVEVKNNTTNKIILRTAGEEDAAIGGANLGSSELRPSHLMNVEPFHGYARTAVHSAIQPPFYLRTLPPLTFRPIGGHFSQAWHDSVSDESVADALWHDELRLLHEQHRQQGDESVIRDLVTLDAQSFAALVAAQRNANQRAALALLRDPKLAPDPVQRAIQISRARHGLPRWFYEAHYRRLQR